VTYVLLRPPSWDLCFVKAAFVGLMVLQDVHSGDYALKGAHSALFALFRNPIFFVGVLWNACLFYDAPVIVVYERNYGPSGPRKIKSGSATLAPPDHVKSNVVAQLWPLRTTSNQKW
jgi:hypothetical protein